MRHLLHLLGGCFTVIFLIKYVFTTYAASGLKRFYLVIDVQDCNNFFVCDIYMYYIQPCITKKGLIIKRILTHNHYVIVALLFCLTTSSPFVNMSIIYSFF